VGASQKWALLTNAMRKAWTGWTGWTCGNFQYRDFLPKSLITLVMDRDLTLSSGRRPPVIVPLKLLSGSYLKSYAGTRLSFINVRSYLLHYSYSPDLSYVALSPPPHGGWGIGSFISSYILLMHLVSSFSLSSIDPTS
jgi:hypothetical protein